MSHAEKPWIQPIEILHNIDSDAYYVRVEFTTVKQVRRQALLPRGQMDDPRAAIRELASRGAAMPATCRDDVKKALAAPNCPVAEITDKSGWHNGAYVLPDCVIGKADSLRATHPELHDALCAGSTRVWRKGLKPACAQSSYLPAVLAAAFAGPLLRPLGYEESVVIHLFGKTSTGKSLALTGAQSVFQSAERNGLRTFDITDRAIEEEAARCNDGLLILDEAGRLDTHEGRRRAQLSKVAFKLAGGQGKMRSAKATTDTALQNVQFSVISLSSGEEPLDDRAMAARKGGEKVRLIGLPVHGKRGVFDLQPAYAERKMLADQMEQVRRGNYGHPIRDFLRQFVADAEGVRKAQGYIAKFMGRVQLDPTPVADRFARKFALIYAAAMLAADYKIGPWSKKHAGTSIRKMYRLAWGEVCPPESEAAALVRRIAKKADDESFFPTVQAGETFDPPDAAKVWGIRREVKGRTYLAVFRQTFSELVRCADTEVLEALKTLKVIRKGKEDRLYVRQLRIQGLSKERVHVIMFNLKRVIELTQQPRTAA